MCVYEPAGVGWESIQETNASLALVRELIKDMRHHLMVLTAFRSTE